LKLADALFKEPTWAYQVVEDTRDDGADNVLDWELKPLAGPTLASEDVEGEFQGLFIIAAQLVTEQAQPQPCYLDLVLPERVAEHHFLQDGESVSRRRGRRAPNGTVIPSIGIEKFGNYTLFLAKENPSVGIDVLLAGIPKARHRDYLAYDLALLLRDQKRYQEAIDAFSIVLEEGHPTEISPILHTLYKERGRLHAAIGQPEKAEADFRQCAVAFEKMYGGAPGPRET
jgi:tetratricopeptide (TPR) repeat protein